MSVFPKYFEVRFSHFQLKCFPILVSEIYRIRDFSTIFPDVSHVAIIFPFRVSDFPSIFPFPTSVSSNGHILDVVHHAPGHSGFQDDASVAPVDANGCQELLLPVSLGTESPESQHRISGCWCVLTILKNDGVSSSMGLG